MDGQKIDRHDFVKVLGFWLSEDIGNWSKTQVRSAVRHIQE